MKTRARALVAATSLTLTFGLTGCSWDDSDTDGVASAGGDASTDSNDATEPLSEDEVYDQMLEYTQCLRDHGLDVDDPAPGEGIQLQLDGGPHQADAALEACEDLAPPAPPGAEGDEDEVRQDMLDFAQCMRDHGVEEFADPKPGEGIGIGPEVAEDPDFDSAEQVCGEIFGGPDSGETQRFGGSTP